MITTKKLQLYRSTFKHPLVAPLPLSCPTACRSQPGIKSRGRLSPWSLEPQFFSVASLGNFWTFFGDILDINTSKGKLITTTFWSNPTALVPWDHGPSWAQPMRRIISQFRWIQTMSWSLTILLGMVFFHHERAYHLSFNYHSSVQLWVN